jgi:hypothetical protein
VAAPAAQDFRSVGVEHAVIVAFAIVREGVMHVGIGHEARSLETGLHHAQAAEREDRPLERRVGLQPDDHLVVAVDPPRRMRQHRRGMGGVDVEHALLALRLEVRL